MNLEGEIKLFENRVWKEYYCMLANACTSHSVNLRTSTLTLSLFKNVRAKRRLSQNKVVTLNLTSIFGLQTGFLLERQNNTLAFLSSKLVTVIAFDDHHQLDHWEFELSNIIGRGQQFWVKIDRCPLSCELPSDSNARLLVYDGQFALVSGYPPLVKVHSSLSHLKRFGALNNRFCFEVGQVGHPYNGLYIMMSGQRDSIKCAFRLAKSFQLDQTLIEKNAFRFSRDDVFVDPADACGPALVSESENLDPSSQESGYLRPRSTFLSVSDSDAKSNTSSRQQPRRFDSNFNQSGYPNANFHHTTSEDDSSLFGSLKHFKQDYVNLNVNSSLIEKYNDNITNRPGPAPLTTTTEESDGNFTDPPPVPPKPNRLRRRAAHLRRLNENSKQRCECETRKSPNFSHVCHPRPPVPLQRPVLVMGTPKCPVCHCYCQRRDYINQAFIDSLQYYYNVDYVVLAVSRDNETCKCCERNIKGKSTFPEFLVEPPPTPASKPKVPHVDSYVEDWLSDYAESAYVYATSDRGGPPPDHQAPHPPDVIDSREQESESDSDNSPCSSSSECDDALVSPPFPDSPPPSDPVTTPARSRHAPERFRFDTEAVQSAQASGRLRHRRPASVVNMGDLTTTSIDVKCEVLSSRRKSLVLSKRRDSFIERSAHRSISEANFRQIDDLKTPKAPTGSFLKSPDVTQSPFRQDHLNSTDTVQPQPPQEIHHSRSKSAPNMKLNVAGAPYQLRQFRRGLAGGGRTDAEMRLPLIGTNVSDDDEVIHMVRESEIEAALRRSLRSQRTAEPRKVSLPKDQYLSTKKMDTTVSKFDKSSKLSDNESTSTVSRHATKRASSRRSSRIKQASSRSVTNSNVEKPKKVRHQFARDFFRKSASAKRFLSKPFPKHLWKRRTTNLDKVKSDSTTPLSPPIDSPEEQSAVESEHDIKDSNKQSSVEPDISVMSRSSTGVPISDTVGTWRASHSSLGSYLTWSPRSRPPLNVTKQPEHVLHVQVPKFRRQMSLSAGTSPQVSPVNEHDRYIAGAQNKFPRVNSDTSEIIHARNASEPAVLPIHHLHQSDHEIPHGSMTPRALARHLLRTLKPLQNLNLTPKLLRKSTTAADHQYNPESLSSASPPRNIRSRSEPLPTSMITGTNKSSAVANVYLQNLPSHNNNSNEQADKSTVAVAVTAKHFTPESSGSHDHDFNSSLHSWNTAASSNLTQLHSSSHSSSRSSGPPPSNSARQSRIMAVQPAADHRRIDVIAETRGALTENVGRHQPRVRVLLSSRNGHDVVGSAEETRRFRRQMNINSVEVGNEPAATTSQQGAASLAFIHGQTRLSYRSQKRISEDLNKPVTGSFCRYDSMNDSSEHKILSHNAHSPITVAPPLLPRRSKAKRLANLATKTAAPSRSRGTNSTSADSDRLQQHYKANSVNSSHSYPYRPYKNGPIVYSGNNRDRTSTQSGSRVEWPSSSENSPAHFINSANVTPRMHSSPNDSFFRFPSRMQDSEINYLQFSDHPLASPRADKSPAEQDFEEPPKTPRRTVDYAKIDKQMTKAAAKAVGQRQTEISNRSVSTLSLTQQGAPPPTPTPGSSSVASTPISYRKGVSGKLKKSKLGNAIASGLSTISSTHSLNQI